MSCENILLVFKAMIVIYKNTIIDKLKKKKKILGKYIRGTSVTCY